MPSILTGLDGHGTAGIPVLPWCSPLVELGGALHVLASPDHHAELASWVDDMRARISPALSAELDAWSFTFRAIRAVPFLPGGVPATMEWDEQVERLRTVPARALAAQLLRPLLAETGVPIRAADARQRIARWAAARGREVISLANGLLAHDPATVHRFVDVVQRCGEEFFATEWTRLRPELARRTAATHDLLRREPAARVIATLAPGITAQSGLDRVTLEKVHTKRIDVGKRGLYLAASHFAGPHLYLADAPPLPPALIHPANPATGQAAPAPAQLLLRLEALAHPMRLRICRAVATEWRSAGEIASLWQLEPTQVTKHLRMLERAAIVSSRRNGRYVLYTLNETTVRELGTDALTVLWR